MASNPRPTTSTTVTYGTLSTTADQRALAPVLIAPRYAVHNYADGYADAHLCDYNAITADPSEVLLWPGKTEDNSSIDIASAVLVAHNPWIQLNSTLIEGTVDSQVSNKIKVSNSIVAGTGTLDPALGDFSVRVGDKVLIGGNQLATITGIGGTPKEASATILAIGSTVSSAPEINVDGDGAVPYTGKDDATYLIKVVSVEGSAVKVLVTALTGEVGYAETLTVGTTAVAIGTRGITIKFDTTDQVAGDCWRVDCKAATIGAYNIIYVNKQLTASANVSLAFVTTRYTAEYQSISDVYITANRGGITLAEDIYVPVNGTACKVIEATLYMNYRELLLEDAYTVVSCSATNAAKFAGIADPQNPMGLLFAACSQVPDGYFNMIACDTTAAGYIQAINYAAQFENLYSFVTWDQSPAIRAAQVAAITKYADPLIAKFKRAWFASTVSRDAVVYDRDDSGNALLAQIDAAGVVTLATPGNAITGGVAPGDYLVVYGSYDAVAGTEATVRYKVTEVTDADTLTVSDAAFTAMSRVEFVRTLDSVDYAKAVSAESASYNNHRINYVWSAGTVNCLDFSDVNPVVVAAVNATYRAGLPPHAPMTDLTVPGIKLNDTYKLSDDEYEIMNAGGVWIVFNNIDGEVINYHQITTKTDGTIAEEDSCVSAGDYIVRVIRHDLKEVISPSGNVHSGLVPEVDGQINATMNYLMGIPYAAKYGPLVEGYTIKELGQPESNNAAFVVKMDIDTPQPMLDGGLYFNLI